ncbi:MAG TPA: aryl-sulfate sulfotransferase [Polyangiaceae bacterium]|nr:aryl-sulfate sulfotransferase [Polyangiaceae bacterium]
MRFLRYSGLAAPLATSLLALAACSGAEADGTGKTNSATHSAGAGGSGASGGTASGAGMTGTGGAPSAGGNDAAAGNATAATSNGGSVGSAMQMGGMAGSSAGAGAGGSLMTGGAGMAAAGMAGASMAGASGSSGGGAPLGSLTVSNLKIEANPKMSLSAYVSWTSSEAASSEVQFGTDGYTLHVVDTKQATDHKVHVVGMHPETSYKIKAVSTSAAATGSAEGTFTTGKLPTNAPAKGTLVANEVEKMQPGWTLTNYFVGSGNQPGIMLILDEEAIPVWYYVHGTGGDQFGMTSTVFLPNGNVLVGNAAPEPAEEVTLEGEIVWSGPTGGSPSATHHTSKLANGHYIIVRESNTSARMEELDAMNKVVWQWDLYDFLEPKTTAADWCHLNSVSEDAEKGILYFNCRFQGLFGVNHSTGDLLWQMGAAIDDSSSGDIKYLPDNSVRFNDSHDPEVHADGTVLFYDNEGWSSHTGGEGNGTYHTKVVEYQLDQAKKEATLTWEFPGKFAVDAWYKNDWATPIWGDANRLPNGNVLITAGVKSSTAKTRIFEVTREGEVVWGFEWPSANNGSYRANRISPPPATKL